MANPLFRPFIAPPDAPALGSNIAMPNPAPSMGAGVLPNVSVLTPPPTQTQKDSAERDRLINTGSGIDQVQNPLLRGIARAGDIAASVFTPRAAQFIPGTTLHHQLQVNQATNNVAKDQAEEQATAQTANEAATTAHTKAATDALLNPNDKFTPIQTDSGFAAFDPATGKATPVLGTDGTQLGTPYKAEKYTFQQTDHGLLKIDSKGNVSPVTLNGEPIGKPKVDKPDTPEQQFIDDYTKKNPNAGIGDAIHAYAAATQKPPVINVNAGTAALDRETKQFGTPHQKAVDSANSQLEKIADARAMINGNAEAQGLGIPKVLTALVGGQGTGVRITQAELQSIAHARGLSGDVEGTLNKLAGKGALSHEQQRQLTQIMDDVKARILQKQAIAGEALDKINTASSREQIIQADTDARKKLSDLEKGGGNAGGGNTPPPGAKVRDYSQLGGK